MTSTNEELPSQTQTKPRISPLEYRNTDLVSRLLAATPPYLYNMSLVPNTYFFSEMLRSFVQAKTERTNAPIPRRSRKRSWTQTKTSDPGQTHHKLQKLPIEDTWKPSTDVNYYDEHKLSMLPELQNKEKMYSGLFPPGSNLTSNPNPNQVPPNSQNQNHNTTMNQLNQLNQINTLNQTNTESSSNLILPPPPPIWYPPLYNTPPYGIDPLHFFIDLRVSGHIYDRKKSMEKAQEESDLLLKETFPNLGKSNIFKSSKHASAFSVPVKNHPHPINLSKAEDVEHKPMKFDVKSLGLESTHNKTGINYVMNNIERVYKDLHECTDRDDSVAIGEGLDGERKKRELKELIGLELDVDYMSQSNKMGIKHGIGMSATANDNCDGDGGVVVEVVDVQDDDNNET